MERHQTTLKSAIEFSGVGLHTGIETHVRIEPAEAGSGINFVRTDLEDGPVVHAAGANLRPSERRTCLKNGSAEIYTAEHLLAALWTAPVDNATMFA